jgi:hypothetical protein
MPSPTLGPLLLPEYMYQGPLALLLPDTASCRVLLTPLAYSLTSKPGGALRVWPACQKTQHVVVHTNAGGDWPGCRADPQEGGVNVVRSRNAMRRHTFSTSQQQ